MERGLLWLPLLFLFFWLVWSGKKEYQKVENYQIWAENFDKSKYDIYAVLGLKGREITWGKPTENSIINEHSFSLDDIIKINLTCKNEVLNPENLPKKGEGNLQFLLKDSQEINIPFTDINLAGQWFNYLNNL